MSSETKTRVAWRRAAAFITIVIVAVVSGRQSTTTEANLAEHDVSLQSKLASKNHYGSVPLVFEANRGQADPNVRFISRAHDFTVLLTDHNATFVLGSGKNNDHSAPDIVRMSFVGSSRPLHAQAFGKQETISNYFRGKDPSHWTTGVPNFSRVYYRSVYPGVDLAFYGNQRRLEHDFMLAPHGDYRQIRIRLEGSSRLTTDKDGSLIASTANGDLKFEPPVAYQSRGDQKNPVKARYILVASDEFRFELGSFNANLPVVIDPILAYSTYLAGSSSDNASAIAVDSTGSAYVTGLTYSTDFPTQNPEQGTCSNSCAGGDVFVTKFNPSGSALVFSTFVGGSAYDTGSAIAIDPAGNVLVSGTTSSLDFPQKNPLSAILNFATNHAFALSLSASGSVLNFSTYLGGTGTDSATGISADAAGNVYVSGFTSSWNFPLTSGNQIGPPPSPNNDVFLTKLAGNGSLLFSTLIGGTSANYGGTFGSSPFHPISVAVDLEGDAFLAGAAYAGFPTTAGSYQPNYAGSGYSTNAFVAKLNPTGSSFISASYLGGSGNDGANQVTLDGGGNVFLTGTTGSLNFPITAGVFQATNIQKGNVSFVTKMDSSLSSLIFSTYLGGSKPKYGSGVIATGVAVDSKGKSYVVGYTAQSDFPLRNQLQNTLPQAYYGATDAAFLSVLNASGTALSFSTFFSGSVGNAATAVAVDAAGNPYMTGNTSDPDLPTTSGAFQTAPPSSSYGQHAFVTKFLPAIQSPGACLSTNILYFGAVEPSQSSSQTVAVKNCGKLNLNFSNPTISNSIFSITQNGCTSVIPGASCSMTVTYSPAVADGVDTGTLLITDNAPITPQTVQLNGYSAYPHVTIYATSLNAPDEVLGLTSQSVLAQVNSDGALPLHITPLTATGDFAPVNLCPSILYSGQSCYVGVTFTPTATGTRTGTLSLYDDSPGSPQVLTLSGNGLATYPQPTISYISPGSAHTGSPSVHLFITGDEFFPTSVVTINGKIVLSKPGFYPGELLVTIPSSMLTKVANLAVQVLNPSPGGASAPVNFAVYSQTALGAADIIYEPFTQKFYASIPATAATNPNTLVTVDPFTGILGTPIPIGNDPDALGLSDDGMTLYIALNASNSIVAFNLLTQSVGTAIPLGVDPNMGPLNAATIQVQPSHPNNLVATLAAGYGNADGIDWIKNGQVISQFLNEPPTNTAVGGTKFLNATNIYGWNSGFGSNGVSHFDITSQGLLEAPGFTGAWGLGPFDTDGKFLYDVNGQIFNATTGAVLGTFAGVTEPASAVLTDKNSGRTFLLDQYNGLYVFDSKTFANVGSLSWFGLNNVPNRLQHWGPTGLSFLNYDYSTGGYDLVLLLSNLFNPVPGPNSTPILTSISPTSVTSGSPNFILTVTGSNFVRGAVVQWNGKSRTTNWLSASTLTADIPASDVAGVSTAKISVLNPTPGGGVSGYLSLPIQ